MFDFTNRNSTVCALSDGLNNYTITELAAAIFQGDTKEPLPDQVTICISTYVDIEDCDQEYFPYMAQTFPLWSFADENGGVNISLKLSAKWLTYEYRLVQLVFSNNNKDPFNYGNIEGRLLLLVT